MVLITFTVLVEEEEVAVGFSLEGFVEEEEDTVGFGEFVEEEEAVVMGGFGEDLDARAAMIVSGRGGRTMGSGAGRGGLMFGLGL